MRADNYALSEETKRLRDNEQARLTDHAYDEALRLLAEAPRRARPGRRRAAREGDARPRGAARAVRRRRARVALVRRGRRRPRARRLPRPVAFAASGAERPSRRDRRRRPRRVDRAVRRALRRRRVEHRETVEEQGVEAASLRVGDRRGSSCSRALGPRDAGRQVPREARPGHAPRRLRGRATSPPSSSGSGRRSAADRRGAAARDVRPRGRVRPSRGDRRRSGRVRQR